MKRQGNGDGFAFQTALGAETAALGWIDEADFFLVHAESFRDLVQGAEGRIVGNPDRQPAGFLVPLRMCRMGLHGGMLDHRHEILLVQY